MLFLKPPNFLAHLAEYIPGLFFNADTSKPESSEIEYNPDFKAKYFAFKTELSLNVFPVSLGGLIPNLIGEIFLIL